MADAAPMMKNAYHINDGLVSMYAVDAHSAAARHPDEWSLVPWTSEATEAARKARADRYQNEVAAAKAAGVAPPPPLPAPPPPVVLTPEEQAALDEFRAKQADARKLLEDAAKEEADAKAKADAIAEAKAIVAQSPPTPDPVRRPFGRKGDPSPAERAQLEKAAAKRAQEQADRDAKAAADKDAAKQAAQQAAADRAAMQQT